MPDQHPERRVHGAHAAGRPEAAEPSARLDDARAFAAHLSSIDEAEEPRLSVVPELGDLVEDEGAGVRVLERRRRASAVTEEQWQHGVPPHARTVEDDEGLRPAWAVLVERLRELLLSGPRLPLDRGGQIAQREPLAERVETTHRDARAEHPAEADAR